MSTIKLSKEQVKQVVNDMDEQTEMLSKKELEFIATKLNKEVNIPFISENTEQTMLVKMVKRIDRFFYQNLPNELYGLVKNTSDGISEKEAKELKSILGTRLNKKIDIPYVPEWIEQEIFELAVKIIVNAMRKKYSILNQPEEV